MVKRGNYSYSEFYHLHYPTIPDKSSTEIENLSNTLRKLQTKVGDNINEKYRNLNGVYMKLMNFHHFNPNHSGEGLRGGSKLDEEIFLEFQNDIINLSKISNLIINNLDSDETFEIMDIDDEVFEFQENFQDQRSRKEIER